MTARTAEQDRLNDIADDSWYFKGVNAIAARYSATIFRRHWRGPRCLELGPAEGIVTEVLAREFDDLTVVEGSERFARALVERHPAVRVVHSLFEDFDPDDSYDTILLGHVLEHVADPTALLASARRWLSPGGLVCAAVPNARSLHRQAGVLMGILPEEHALNETDIHHGHRRVYDPEQFRAEFARAGLGVAIFGGYWLKPVSNDQVDRHWEPLLVNAYMQLGERYPDIAAEIYVIAAA